MPVFDAINKLSTDMLVSSEYAAMPRRYIVGAELPEKRDDQGKPTGEIDTQAALDQTKGRLWWFESPDAKPGQFPEANLSGFTTAIDSLTAVLASLSGIPARYFGHSTEIPASAEALRSSENSLVKRVKRKQRVFGGAWEEVMRIAAAIESGSFNPDLDRLETMWANPSTPTIAESADAYTKLTASGLLPDRQALEDMGYSPVQIERMDTMTRRTATITTTTPEITR